MVRGVVYTHSAGVCHHDVSLENFLLDADMNAVLIDFGMAEILTPLTSSDDGGGGAGEQRWAPIACMRKGKSRYMAVEVYNKHAGTNDPCALDAWSLGVCVFFLATGRFPWTSRDEGANTTDAHFRFIVCDGKLREFLDYKCVGPLDARA